MEKKIFILLFHKHDWVNSLSKWCCIHVNPLWNIHCIDDSNLQKYIPLSFLKKAKNHDFNTRMLLYMIFLVSHHGGICILSSFLCLSSFDNFLKEVIFNTDNYYFNQSIIISNSINPHLKKYLEFFLQNGSHQSLSLNKSILKKKYFELISHDFISLEDSKIINTCKLHNFKFSKAKLYKFDSYVLNIFPSLNFIHVGKCGGTAIMYNFIKNGIYLEQYYHLNRPNNEIEKQNYFLIWIRNPISRFVSAFYHAKNTLQGDNSLIPYRKDKKPFVFSETYDNLISGFDTANDLALNLSRGHLNNRKNAMNCLFSQEEHILKGLGYYTNNGDFIRKNKNRIFVGRLEHFEKDLKYFVETKLKVPFTIHTNIIRENKNINDKSLCQEAIDNLIAFYNDSDYEALKTLLDNDLISKETFSSYFRY
jgi:hypothetical protein